MTVEADVDRDHGSRDKGRPHNLCDSALAYAGINLPVLPLRTRGKEPLTPHGFKDASTEPVTIRDWWQRWPSANVGIAIPQGYVVVDVDTPEAIDRLKAQDRYLPATATAQTARGHHFWYTTTGQLLRNAVGVAPGVDLRGLGGYVVAPQSIHPSGARYTWLVPLKWRNVSEAPDWLLELAESRHEPRPDRANRAPDEWFERIASPVQEGQRNQSLAVVAGLLFRRHSAPIAAELAYCWARVKLSPPLADREVWRTINSIANCELRRRKERP